MYYVEHIVLHHSAVEAGGLHMVDERDGKGRFHSQEGADWSEAKIQDLVFIRNQSENSMTQLARAMSGG